MKMDEKEFIKKFIETLGEDGITEAFYDYCCRYHPDTIKEYDKWVDEKIITPNF